MTREELVKAFEKWCVEAKTKGWEREIVKRYKSPWDSLAFVAFVKGYKLGSKEKRGK